MQSDADPEPRLPSPSLRSAPSPAVRERGDPAQRAGWVRVAAPEPVLRVDDLRIELPTRRGALIAVDDVSFAIAPGEVLGVVGESGAGKSLTGAAIIGLLEPPLRIAGGRISFAGRRIDNLPHEAMRQIRGKEI